MLQVVICDDDFTDLKKIQASVDRYFQTHSEWTAQVEAFSKPLELLARLEKTGGYDIAILDVCMPEATGTEIGRLIRRRFDKTEIIFLTTSAEYAVEAFALKAAHYLVKPYREQEFQVAMDRAMSGFANQEPAYIAIRSESDELHHVELDDILYIESRGHSLTLYAKTQTVTEGRRSLATLFETLQTFAPGQFIIPYKGYIVNQKAVSVIEREAMVLKNGERIPIPKRGYKQLQNQYMDFLFRGFAKKESG